MAWKVKGHKTKHVPTNAVEHVIIPAQKGEKKTQADIVARVTALQALFKEQ